MDNLLSIFIFTLTLHSMLQDNLLALMLENPEQLSLFLWKEHRDLYS